MTKIKLADTKENKYLNSVGEHPVSYQRKYSLITGDIVSGVLLSQLFFWDLINEEKCKNKEDFYNTDEKLAFEIGTTTRRLRTAKEKLLELNFVEAILIGFPARTQYKINREAVMKALEKEKTPSKFKELKADIKRETKKKAKEKVVSKELAIPELKVVKMNEKLNEDLCLLFREKINPMISMDYKGHQEQVDKMLETMGVEEITLFARASISVAKKPYAPAITTPSELSFNLAKLRLYLIKQKEMNKVGGRGCVGSLENVINTIKK